MTTPIRSSAIKKISAVILATVVIGGCSSTPTVTSADQYLAELSESELYKTANDNLNDDNYSEAIQALRALEARHPFGPYAEQAQLDIIYAYYQNGEAAAARAAADRFIRLHPQNKDTDYAYYLKGLASNTASVGLLDRYLPLDQSRRDPGQSKESFNEFAELLIRYPDSPYAADARQRMVALRNRLAEYEIHAANYYLKRKAYIAAINRAQYVIENMQQTDSMENALIIMIEGYQHLQMHEPAGEALAVLQTNFPNSAALDKNGKFVGYKVFEDANPSILSTLTFGLLGGWGNDVKDLPEPVLPRPKARK